MTRAWAWVLPIVAAAPLAAQHPAIHASLGQGVAQYREQDRVLDFRGSGPVARLDVTWRDFGLLASTARTTLDPTDGDAPYVLGFKATEDRLALRYRPLRRYPVALEVGTIKRTPTPDDNAQAFRAWTLGAVVHLALADGAEVESRGAWLVGTKFSRGGKAKTAVALGLRAAYRPLPRYAWGWVVVDYSYERLERRTDFLVPLQGSTVSFGFEARVIP